MSFPILFLLSGWFQYGGVVVSVEGGFIDKNIVGCLKWSTPKLPLCSGHGLCQIRDLDKGTIINVTEPFVKGSQCYCQPDWTGISDFVNNDTHDCGTNITFIRVIWVFVFLSTICEFLLIIEKLYDSYQSLKSLVDPQRIERGKLGQGKQHASSSQLSDTKKDKNSSHSQLSTSQGEENNEGKEAKKEGKLEKKKSGHRLVPSNSLPEVNTSVSSLSSAAAVRRRSTQKKILFRHYRVCCAWPVVRISMGAGLSAFCLMIISIIRMISPLSAVGVSPGVTYLYAAMETFYWLAERVMSFSWLQVRGKLVRFNSEHEAAALKAITQLRYTLYLGLILDFGRIGAIVSNLYDQGEQNQQTFLYYLSVMVSTIIASLALIKAGRAVEKILTDGLDSLKGVAQKERTKALQNIRRTIRQQKQFMAYSIPSSLLISTWPFLRSKISYLQLSLVTLSINQMSHLYGLSPPSFNKFAKMKASGQGYRPPAGGGPGGRPQGGQGGQGGGQAGGGPQGAVLLGGHGGIKDELEIDVIEEEEEQHLMEEEEDELVDDSGTPHQSPVYRSSQPQLQPSILEDSTTTAPSILDSPSKIGPPSSLLSSFDSSSSPRSGAGGGSAGDLPGEPSSPAARRALDMEMMVLSSPPSLELPSAASQHSQGSQGSQGSQISQSDLDDHSGQRKSIFNPFR